MNDYYLLIDLNKKEVKITNISQNDNGIVEVSIESKKKKVIEPYIKVHTFVYFFLDKILKGGGYN